MITLGYDLMKYIKSCFSFFIIDRFCLSVCNCCRGSNTNLHRRGSSHTPYSSNNLTASCSQNSEMKGINGCGCFGSICLNRSSCVKGCSWLCLPKATSSCGAMVLTLSCCCFGIRKKSVFDRNSCVSERRDHM